MFSHNCQKKGHRLEARYDLVSPAYLSEDQLDVLIMIAQDVEDLKNNIYVHDICVKCGLTVSRDKPPSSSDASDHSDTSDDNVDSA